MSKTKWAAVAAVAAALLSTSVVPARAAIDLEFGADGLSGVRWHGAPVSTREAFTATSIVFEHTDDADSLWGFRYTAPSPGAPTVAVDSETQRVARRYAWGEIAARYTPHPNRLDIHLTIQNTGRDAIADFHLKLFDVQLRNPGDAHRRGAAFYILDRPQWFKLPVAGGHVFATVDTFATPVAFGFSHTAGAMHEEHATLFLQGGVPADKADTLVQPVQGMPHIAPGETLELTVSLRFASPDTPDNDALQPYLEAFRAAQGVPMRWLDRRPIGRFTIPSSPNRVTVRNPRGWFDDPHLDLRTPEGQADFRDRLTALVDDTIAALQTASAQGVVIWNIEGGHVYPAFPMGDPRQLATVAPEMDAVADTLFARFREAGYRTGVTIRPQNLHFCDRRQNWALGGGAYDPERELLPAAEAAMRRGAPPERIYPLVERLSDKIRHARERWGCTLFYIEDNGAWRIAAPGRLEEWMLFDARVLRRLREEHPDVLLIPRYTERFWRPARIGELQRVVDQERERAEGTLAERGETPGAAFLASLHERLGITYRGIAESRLGGIPDPPWDLAHYLVLDRTRQARVGQAFSGPRHILREAYWANAAPFVRMNQRERIVAYMRSLGQHMEYTREQAEAIADTLIPYEQTPAEVRDWLPDAFSVKDLTGADIPPRREALVRGAAWGDVLMWDTATPPGAIRDMSLEAEARQARLFQAARRIGMLAPEEAAAGNLPVSLVWRHGAALDAGPLTLAANPPPTLRVRAVTAPNGREALLMVGWRGGRARAVRFQPGLPGLDLSGPATEAWCLDTGRYLHTGQPLDVAPDVGAGLSVLYVRSTDRPAPPTPPGMLLGADFDRGLEPALGGTLPGDFPPPSGTIADGALQLAHADVRYNVVPDWFAGAIEFDLKPEHVDAEGLAVLQLGHHLDASLRLVQRDGRPALHLTARERETGADAPHERTLFAPLAGAGRWVRVALVWEMGQYELVVDGQSAAIASGLVVPRRRDGSVMTPGIRIGDTAPGATRALLDGLAVYNRPLTAEMLAGRRGRAGLQPAEMSDQPVSVWMWGQFPEAVTVAVSARQTGLDWAQVETFEVRLYERLESGRLQVAEARLPATGGMASGRLVFKRAGAMEADAGAPRSGGARGPGRGLDIMGLGAEADDLGALLGDDLALDKPHILLVEAQGSDGKLVTRRVDFEASVRGIRRNRW